MHRPMVCARVGTIPASKVKLTRSASGEVDSSRNLSIWLQLMPSSINHFNCSSDSWLKKKLSTHWSRTEIHPSETCHLSVSFDEKTENHTCHEINAIFTNYYKLYLSVKRLLIKTTSRIICFDFLLARRRDSDTWRLSNRRPIQFP